MIVPFRKRECAWISIVATTISNSINALLLLICRETCTHLPAIFTGSRNTLIHTASAGQCSRKCLKRRSFCGQLVDYSRKTRSASAIRFRKETPSSDFCVERPVKRSLKYVPGFRHVLIRACRATPAIVEETNTTVDRLITMIIRRVETAQS